MAGNKPFEPQQDRLWLKKEAKKLKAHVASYVIGCVKNEGGNAAGCGDCMDCDLSRTLGLWLTREEEKRGGK